MAETGGVLGVVVPIEGGRCDDARVRQNRRIAVRREVRDRFGPLPASVELLLKIASLKLLASRRGVTAIESKGDKLMVTRNNDYVMVGGKFPRLTKQEPKARLNEIRKLLLAL